MAVTFSSTDHISVPSSETVLNSSQFSIAGWFKLASASTGNNTRLWDENGSQFDRASWMEIRRTDQSNTGELVFFYRADNVNNMFSKDRVDDGNWHRAFIVRRSSTDHQMFIDGTSKVSSSGDWGTNSGESPGIVVGNVDGAFDGPFVGDMARFAVWTDTALASSDAESFLKTGVWSTQPNYWVEGEYVTPPFDWSGNDVSLTDVGPPSVSTHPSTIAFSFELPVDNPIGSSLGRLVYAATGGDAHFASPTEHRFSTDNGASWSTGNTIPGATNDLAQYGGLAAVAGSTADTVHVLLPQSDPGGTAVEHQHRVSTDGGASWSTGVTLLDESSNTALIRRVQMEVDSSRVYVVGLNASTGKTWLFSSSDSGQTWNNGVVVPTNRCQALAVDKSNSNVYVAGHDASGAGVIKVHRSTDFGQSFGSTITLTSTDRVGGRPRASADNGAVIVGWQNESTGNDEDVEVAVSTDAGASYSTVITAMDASEFQPQADKFNHFDLWQTGQIAHLVAASQDPSTPCPVYHTHSVNGGSSWQTPELAGSAAITVWMSRTDGNWLHVSQDTGLYSRRDLSDISVSTGINNTRLSDMAFCRGSRSFGPGHLPIPDSTLS